MAGITLPGTVFGGRVAAQLDLQAIQENKVKLQDDQIGLMRDKISLAQQIRFLGLMNNIKPGQAHDMPGLLDQMSLIQLESGMPSKAAQTASAASRIREQTASIQSKEFKIRQTRLTQFANILHSVQDSPQGYQQALLTMLQTDPSVAHDKQFAQLMQTPWRPGLVKQLENQVISAKDRSLIQYHQAQEGKIAEDEKVDEAKLQLMKREKTYLKDRDKSLAKEGVKPINSEILKSVTDQATRDFPGTDPADIRVRSRPLAEEVVDMVRNQHLTYPEAAQRVYQAAKKAGVFAGLRKMPTLSGTSPANPLQLPYKSDAEAKADGYKRISDNQWYMVKGVPMLALGGHFYTEQEIQQADQASSDLLGNQ